MPDRRRQLREFGSAGELPVVFEAFVESGIQGHAAHRFREQRVVGGDAGGRAAALQPDPGPEAEVRLVAEIAGVFVAAVDQYPWRDHPVECREQGFRPTRCIAAGCRVGNAAVPGHGLERDRQGIGQPVRCRVLAVTSFQCLHDADGGIRDALQTFFGNFCHVTGGSFGLREPAPEADVGGGEYRVALEVEPYGGDIGGKGADRILRLGG